MPRKWRKLLDLMRGFENVAVALSGGCDSSLVLKAAFDALKDKCIAVTVDAPVFPRADIERAKQVCSLLGVPHFALPVDILDMPEFTSNGENRCYYCKQRLFSQMLEFVGPLGFSQLVDGTNADDAQDYRPGLQALSELGIESPLKQIGFTKKEVRDLSLIHGLPTWDYPSNACLASRIPYGDKITDTKLRQVERAERLLISLGFSTCRVRHHGAVARIEVPEAGLPRILDDPVRNRLVSELEALGFAYTALDLSGFKTGSMNLVLGRKEARV